MEEQSAGDNRACGFDTTTDNDCKFLAINPSSNVGANEYTIIRRGDPLVATIKAAIRTEIQPKLDEYLARENADTTSASESEAGDMFFDELDSSGNADESMDSSSSREKENADTTSSSESEAGDMFYDETNSGGNADESMDNSRSSSSDEEMARSSDLA